MAAADSLTIDELMRDTPYAAIHVDAALCIVAWNPDAAAVLRLRPDAVGRPIAEVAPAFGGEATWRRFFASERRARSVWSTVFNEDESVDVEWWRLVLADGGQLLFLTDVTERLKAERQTKSEATALRGILDNVDLAVWILDPQGTYLYQDGKALKTLGLVPGQMVGTSVFDLFRGLPELAVIRGGLTGAAATFKTTGADTEWNNWQVPVFADDGAVEALVGISLDVTDHMRTTRELQSKLDVIERQQRAIRELSTPIIEVWDRVLTLPIVGLVDSTRTAEIMENLLQAVVRHRARYAILDLTGVEVVDTSTASHILGLIRTIRLLGAEGILTGIHPSIAQTIVTLGVDLAGLLVRSNLREALQHCIVQMAKKPGAQQ